MNYGFSTGSKGRAITVARLFLSDTKAATSIEYGLIASLVSIALLTAGMLVREQVVILFETVRDGVLAARGP